MELTNVENVNIAAEDKVSEHESVFYSLSKVCASAFVYCTELTQTRRDSNTVAEDAESNRKQRLVYRCFVIHGGCRGIDFISGGAK